MLPYLLANDGSLIKDLKEMKVIKFQLFNWNLYYIELEKRSLSNLNSSGGG
ncbi:MAG: hypothetical protein ACXVLT_08625 [Flavisolibacter sp.]